MQEIILFITRHPILSLSWITLSVMTIILTFNSKLYTKVKSITHAQAIQLINKEKAITIDLRSYNDFYKGHIINSINLNSSKIKDNIRELEKYKQKPIIIATTNGIEAIKPAKQLAQYGFQNVFILRDGITGWSDENLPLTSGKNIHRNVL